jgi:predicted esterase
MQNHPIWIPVIASCVLGVAACAAHERSSSQQPHAGGSVLPPATSAATSSPSSPSPASGAGVTAPAGAGVIMAGNGAAGTSGRGTPGSTPAMGGTGGATGGPATMPDPNAMSGDDGRLPIIPPISGDCPAFMTSTITLMGLPGISIQAGAKKEGSPTGPLVFYWHGTGSSALEGGMFPGTTEVLSLGGIVVAFSGSLGTGGDCSGTGTFSQDDYKVADQIVACAVKNHNIDARRIYATGCSAGGLFAGCMGIERSSYLAAAVANSGGVTIGYGPFQDPKRVPAVMTMHGGPADMVIVTFSQTSMAYDTLMLKHNSAMVIDCDHMGGHCGAPPALYASGWQFMKDHPFGTKPSPYASGLPAGFDPSCKIWTDTMGMLPYGGDPTGMPKTPVTGMVWTPP